MSRKARLIKPFCRRLANNEDGTAAIEFGIWSLVFAPLFLTGVHLGFMEFERMTLDHALRSAAQYAMTDPGASSVCTRLRSVALKNFSSVSETCADETADLKTRVTRFCACPSALDTAVACTTACGTQATRVFYRITGEKIVTFSLLPIGNSSLTSSVQIQTR